MILKISSLVVSILNGCAMCIDAHADWLLKHELTKSHVQIYKNRSND